MTELAVAEGLSSKIRVVRGKQVLLDEDLAELYTVQTKRLNEQVRRNVERFPEDFMFQLTKEEFDSLKSQNATASWGGRRTPPYAFTEHGVAMLSGVLRSKKAVKVNIAIMRAFIAMRKTLLQNQDVLLQIRDLDARVSTHDQQLEEVFSHIQNNQFVAQQGVFFDGETFDAFKFIADLIKQAKRRIVLIDNYVNEDTLHFFTKTPVEVHVLTRTVPKKDLRAYQSQYDNVTVHKFLDAHDRFLIVDEQVYLVGASLKDAGKKWFGFTKLHDASSLLRRIQDIL